MTKLLYIPIGEYVSFVSSTFYDKRHSPTNRVIDFEDSFNYFNCHLTLEEYIKDYLLTGGDPINNEVRINSGMIITREEFEIIYD